MGSAAAPRSSPPTGCTEEIQFCIERALPPTEIANWAGKVSETAHFDTQHQVMHYLVEASSTTCSDVGVVVSEFTGATCFADVQATFVITTETEDGKTVKVCSPDLNAEGFNATETFTDSLGDAFPPIGGVAYLSAAYTDDQSLPTGVDAHFHFEGSKEDTGATNVIDETANAVGLRSCSSAGTNVKPTSAGTVYATHN